MAKDPGTVDRCVKINRTRDLGVPNVAVSRLPSLNALKAFESVARLGALNRAAEELNVTESAVSRQIRALEDDLRVELFRRVHRGVRLSPV